MPKKKKIDREASKGTEKKMIEVAIDMFSRNGFTGTSIRDIAAQMGMTSSNLYYYFSTKEKMLTEIERQTLEPIIQEIRRVSTIDLPPDERLALLIKLHLEYLDAHRKASRIFSFSEDKLPGNRVFQQEAYSIYKSEIARLLSSYGKKEDPTVITFCTLGVIMWFLRWYRPDGKLPLDEVISALIKFIMQGILGATHSKENQKKIKNQKKK